jgi:hypothetical protein
LSDNQLDQFIEMGEAKIYEVLRIPPLEKLQAYSVSIADSSITLPSGFIELISLKKTGAGACSVNPSTNTTRALCSLASGTWTDSDKDDDIILSRVDEKAFANKKIKNAYIRVGNNILITDDDGEQIASGEYILNYYKADVSVGTLVDSVEVTDQFIIGTEYEVVLFAALSVAALFLGDVESEQKYSELLARKIDALNIKEKNAALKGGSFSAVYSAQGI